jgi:hypothetical protein
MPLKSLRQMDQKLGTYNPSLNTQSCIKGLLVAQDFCFLAVLADRPVLKIYSIQRIDQYTY